MSLSLIYVSDVADGTTRSGDAMLPSLAVATVQVNTTLMSVGRRF